MNSAIGLDELALSLEQVSLSHDKNLVISELDLHIHPGEVTCLLGPSGSGKTTILRAIAGFHPVDSGAIKINGQLVADPHINVPTQKRHLGMVFQDYALFPHLNVYKNISFGIEGELSAKAVEKRVGQLLEMVDLTGLKTSFVHELSGGQQQRVALARALAQNPKLILLDEPFSNLDNRLRHLLADELRTLFSDEGVSALVVTHSHEEAFALADHVAVIDKGKLQQWDSPYNLYHEPSNLYVANFLGDGILLPGTLKAPDEVDTPFGALKGNRAYPFKPGTPVEVLLRPDDFIIDPAGPITGTVHKKYFHGASTTYIVNTPQASVKIICSSHNDYSLGTQLSLSLCVDHMIVYPKTR